MNGKLISLLALCLLAACQRTPESKTAAPENPAIAALDKEQRINFDLMRAVYGDAVASMAATRGLRLASGENPAEAY